MTSQIVTMNFVRTAETPNVNDIDIFLFVETWLNSDDLVEIGEHENIGENCFLSAPRDGRSGGGIGAPVKVSLVSTKRNL